MVWVLVFLACLSLLGCGKSGKSNTTLNGIWRSTCVGTGGIGGITAPGANSHTSQLNFNGTSLAYTLQGYTDSGCLTAGNSVSYYFTVAVAGSDPVVTNAADLNMTLNSIQNCTPSCVSDGSGTGTPYYGLYLVAGTNNLSINWSQYSRPTTLAYTFTR